MPFVRLFLMLVGLVAMVGTSGAQSPFGSGATVIKNATVFSKGKIVENCHVLFAGKKIKAVGQSIKIPDDAEVIDGTGKFVIPTLIDSSATMGLFQKQAASRTIKAHFSILDRLDLFNVDSFKDAIEQGVTHVYLRNPAAKGIGGQGSGVVLPKKMGGTTDEVSVKGSQAIHVKLGTANGPVGRYLEVKGLGGQLVAAKKYRESWKKYEEKLKEYVDGLPKASKKKSTAKKPAKKNETKGKAPTKRVGAPDPFVDEDDDHHDEHGNEEEGDHDEFDPSEIAEWDIWGLGNPDEHPVIKARKLAAETAHEDHEIPISWEAPVPRLRPIRSSVDLDGTEPHLSHEKPLDPNDPNGIDLLLCEHCGGQIEGQPHFHEEPQGFDFWQFAPDPKEAAKAKAKAKSSSKKSKEPKEPRFDPAMEAMADVLEGKMRLRIEVHRAEDIKNLLAILAKHPMEVVLEGVTEGYMVAEELAKAEISVLVYGDSIKPIAEAAGGGRANLPIRLPRGFRMPRSFFGRGGPQKASLPIEGMARPDNAAVMSAHGVAVAIAASSKSSNASPQLLLAAGRVAGNGLSKEAALSAVTELPARILGIDDQVGTLKKGQRASFVILSGDPFDASTRVQTIYMDGKSYYKKK